MRLGNLAAGGKFVLALLTALTVGLSASAEDDGYNNYPWPGYGGGGSSVHVPNVRFGKPQFAGPGCPRGSAQVALSRNQEVLSVIFDNYVVEAGAFAGQQQGISACRIIIPMSAPRGYQVQVVKVDYRGFAMLARGTAAQVVSMVSFPGQNRDGMGDFFFQRRLKGPMDKPFILSSRIDRGASSGCGGTTRLITSTHLKIKSNSRKDDVMAGIDSLDASQVPIQLGLRWKRCNPSEK